MKLKIVLLISALLSAGAHASPSPKLLIQGELTKGDQQVIHFADSVRSGEDTRVTSLLQGAYLNSTATSPNGETKLVPWTYYSGVLLNLNPMIAGDGSIMLSVHGIESKVNGFKISESDPKLKIPDIVISEVSARKILDQGKESKIHFGNCKDPERTPSDCEYTLSVTVTKP